MLNRSYHFIPGNRPNLFDRIHSLGADAYILDLEDAVPANEKGEAVSNIRKHFEKVTISEDVFIRINGIEHNIAPLERELLHSFPSFGVVLPKIESAEAIENAIDFYKIRNSRKIISLVESAKGVSEIDSILGLGKSSAVGLGLEDLLSETAFLPEEAAELVSHVRSSIALSAIRWGIPSIDTISTDITGGSDLAKDIGKAKAAGLSAKFSIHPSQIDKINAAFVPDDNLVTLAKSLDEQLSDWDEESGYFKHGGELLSPPKIKKLKNVINFIQKFEL